MACHSLRGEAIKQAGQRGTVLPGKDASMQTTSLAEIITLIEKLSPEEKRQLIEYVARDLQRPSESNS
jgi:hypothetical protein